MLRVLELREFVLAEHVRIDLSEGLNVLTGETGAGKSLLVDALGLLTGVRAESGLVRSGATRALVQAEFEDGTASRALVTEGRNVARLDGEIVTVTELSDTVGARVAVFAQHAQQALLSPQAQRTALDRLLDARGAFALAEWRTTWRERQALQSEREALASDARTRVQRVEQLDAHIAEIDAAALEPGEEETLTLEARALRHADRIARQVRSAVASLDEEGGAVDALALAERDLRDVSDLDATLTTLATELHATVAAGRAIAAELQGFLDTFDAEPGRLDEVEDRLALLQRLFAKYGDGSAGVLAYREEAGRERAALATRDARIDELDARLAEIDGVLSALAGTLHEARRDAGERLTRDVTPLLERLALQGARLTVVLEPGAWGAHGADKIRFDFAANRGERAAPLAQAASGGELSRVMLALWLVTGSDRHTLVFDEVDAGVGGEAAAAVGELLAELAQRHQVLVVTHLAQVAAFADAHVRVGKAVQGDRTISTVTPVTGPDRERELARMLAGNEGEAARSAAQDLLARASRDDRGELRE